MTNNLKSRMITSAAWLIGSNFSGQFLRLFSNLILTRLLVPQDFGLVAAVSTVYIALVMFSDLGIWQSVVNSPDGLKPRFLGTAWLIQLYRSGLLAIGVLCVAGGIYYGQLHNWFEPGSVYSDSRIPALMLIFVASAMLQGLESMNLAVSQRELQVGRLARLDICSQIGSIIITVTLTWYTRSVWALAFGSLAATSIRTVLSHTYLNGPKTRPVWDRLYATEILSYGKWIFLSSIIGFLASSGERIILAGYMTATIFGIFTIAANMLAAVVGIYSAINGHIVFTSLSHQSRNESAQAAHRLHNKVQLIADVLLGFLAGLIFISGSWIIALLYDPRYREAGWMLQWLALGLIGLRYQVVEQLMFARGSPKWVTVNNLLRAFILFGGIPLAYDLYGVPGAIIAVVVSQFGSWPCSIYFKLREGLLTWRSEIMWIPALGAGILVGLATNQLFKQFIGG